MDVGPGFKFFDKLLIAECQTSIECVIFYIDLTHTYYSLPVPAVHVTSTMAPPKKSKPAESEGEEFSDVDGSNFSSDSDEEVVIEGATLTWVCPIVGPQAKRSEFEAVGGQVYSIKL